MVKNDAFDRSLPAAMTAKIASALGRHEKLRTDTARPFLRISLDVLLRISIGTANSYRSIGERRRIVAAIR
jgi:hypothetical protein